MIQLNLMNRNRLIGRPMRRFEKMMIFLPNERQMICLACAEYGFSEDGYKSQEENRGGSTSSFFDEGTSSLDCKNKKEDEQEAGEKRAKSGTRSH